MHVFISADMEGTCGIVDWKETERATPYDYNYYKKQMTLEVKAACEGAISAGAQALFIKDAHDSARNLDGALLPQQARLMRGWSGDPLCMMSGLDCGHYGAVLFTGYHAGATCGGNPLSHTMNTECERILLNGAVMSEFMLNAYTAGYYGVPVPFLSGDAALCDFARGFIPNIVTVPVNEGVGGAVVAMHPDAALKSIREGARRAIKSAEDCPVPMPDYFCAQVRYRDHAAAYRRQFYPGATPKGDKDVCFETDDWYEMLRFFHFVL